MNTHDDIQRFKRSVVAWTIRLAAAALLVTAALEQWDVTKGLAFGLGVGLINFDLMTRFNAVLLRSGPRGSRVAVLGMVVRMAVIFAGMAAVWYKGWNVIAAAAGCFSVYPVLLAHGFLSGRRQAAASADAEGSNA